MITETVFGRVSAADGSLITVNLYTLSSPSGRLTVTLCDLGARIAGIRAGQCAFTVGKSGEGDIPIRMARFTDSEKAERGRLRLTEKLRDSCVEEAAEILAGAAEHHFALERIYGEAMDYDAMTEYRHALVNEIIKRLE